MLLNCATSILHFLPKKTFFIGMLIDSSCLYSLYFYEILISYNYDKIVFEKYINITPLSFLRNENIISNE